MKAFSTRAIGVPKHRRVIAALACGAALCLIAPAAAFASTSAPSAQRAHDVVSHHNFASSSPRAEISGSVVSIAGNAVVVQDGAGFWRTINLGSTTTYVEGPMNLSPAPSAGDIVVGTQISASGVVDVDHTSLDATSVRIELSTSSGTVQSLTASSLTVSAGHDATPKTIDLTPQTVVFDHAGVVALSSVVVGSVVTGLGIVQPDGSLLALYLGARSGREGFNTRIFDTTVPNRFGPNHYGERNSK